MSAPAPSKVYALFISLFCLLTSFLTIAFYFVSEVSSPVAYVAGVSFSALFLFGLDKSLAAGSSSKLDRMNSEKVAKKGGLSRNYSWRVPEVVFYGMAILGGSVGILLGMPLFRHKTKKGKFQLVLVGIFLAQLLIAQALLVR